MNHKKVKPTFKLWFHKGDNYVFGEGAYELLEQIREKKSISAAAKTTSMSYRYAWALIKEPTYTWANHNQDAEGRKNSEAKLR